MSESLCCRSCILKTLSPVISPLFVLLPCKEWMESAQDFFPGHFTSRKKKDFSFIFLGSVQAYCTVHRGIACTVRIQFIQMWALHEESFVTRVENIGTRMIWRFTRHYLTAWISWTDFYGEQLIGLGFPLFLEEFGSNKFPWCWQLFSTNSSCCFWNGTTSFCQIYSR